MGDFVIGQQAAIYKSRYGECSVQIVRIERDTKLYWISDGRKFRKSDGYETGSRDTWSTGRHLKPLDSPEVTAALAEQANRSAYSVVNAAQNRLAKERYSRAAIEGLKQALDAYAETLP